MARVPRGVTCRECGCLNFSSEHEVCDNCRSKTLKFRPTARRQVTDGAKREEASTTSSIGVKRSHNPSNKGNKAPNQPKPAPNKQPVVIDLISDDDDEENEEIEMQQVIKKSLETFRDQEQQRGIFQSREFPTVTFVASDFPTVEESTQMRKNWVGGSRSQPTRGRNTEINGVAKPPTLVSQPVAASKEKVVQKEGASAVEIVEKKVVVTPEKKKEDASKITEVKQEDKKTQKEKEIVPSPAEKETKQSEKAVAKLEMEEKVDPFFQSRVFDAIEFKMSDFPVQTEGLAVARRSVPPVSSFNTAPSATAGQSTVLPTVSKPNDGLGPPKTPTVVSATNPTKPANPATVTPTTQKTTTPATPSSMGKAQSALKTLTGSAVKATPQKSAESAPKPPVVMPATNEPTTPLNSTVVTPSTKAPAVQSSPAAVPITTQVTSAQVTSTTVASAKAGATPPQSRKRISPGLPVITKPATPASSTTKPRSTETTTTTPPASKPTVSVPVAATSAATKSPSVLATGQNQANGNANVLLPKKRVSEDVQRTDDAKRQARPTPTIVKASVDGEGVEFVKVNRAIPPVECPALGYCTAEFLAFMRECGDEDGDEEEDPEEVNRSQLKLLDVVDLTNLSDSENSEAESPMPTPRGIPLQSLPATGQTAAVGASTATAPVSVSGTRTWYVPTLDSERKRTQPEKVMCELCEEKGSPNRLIHCPTCTKYYHKKCAKENGDENICWNCELGTMIDDSELDEEHARHNSEYLAYLKAIRRSSYPENEENEGEVGDENEEQVDEGVEDGDVEMPNADAAEEDNSQAGRSWMEFVGDVTGDVDAGFQEVTNRITEELRDEEKRNLYTRGFVSREEFEKQMTEVEDYYINEEARLQQLERERAIEAKKAAEARKAQAEGEEKASSDQPGSSSSTATDAPSISPSVAQGGGATASTSANPAVTATPVPATLPSAVPHPAVPTPAMLPPSADFSEAIARASILKAAIARSAQLSRDS